MGVFAGQWGSRFMCFDVDDGSHDTVRTIIHLLNGLGIPRDKVYVSVSGGKGYHVEMFFDGIISTEWLHRLYLHVIEDGELDPKKVEFRPTNTAAIKLPLSVHAKTGKTCWYADADTLQPIEDPEFIMDIQMIPVSDIEALDLPELKKPQVEPAAAHPCGHSSEETRNLGTTLVESGTRHNMMRNIAVFERTQGKSREECEARLKKWLSQQDRSLMRTDEEDIQHDMQELLDWVYSERFVVRPTMRIKQAILSKSHLESILQVAGISCRKLLFLLLARSMLDRQDISIRDMSKTLKVSSTVITKSVKRLVEDKRICRIAGRSLKLPDGSFKRENSRYSVPHECPRKNEKTLVVTMSELITNFDRCYYDALDQLIPRFVLWQKLSQHEWREYMEYVEQSKIITSTQSAADRIDQVGKPVQLLHSTYGSLVVYNVNGRLLYPACDVCKCLKFTYPSQKASTCPNKELWLVQENVLANRKAIRRNYIPAEDVKSLAICSKDSEAEAICRWILSNETGVIE